MRDFDEILMMAVERKGSFEAVWADCPTPKSAKALAATADSDWLAKMAYTIFPAGISWKVIEAKWGGIVEAFGGFDVDRLAMMDDDWFDALLSDPRVIRSAAKIRAIQKNAVFIGEVAREAGTFGAKVGAWPEEDYIGLLDWLKANGARLGGNTGAYVLRQMGRDSFILTRDVVTRLVAEGVIDKVPTSKPARAAVQSAFEHWKAQSGRSFTEISRVLAQSVG